MTDTPRQFRVRSNEETGMIDVYIDTIIPDERPHMRNLPIIGRFVHLSLTQAEAWKLGLDLSAEVRDRIDVASEIEAAERSKP